MLYYVHHDGKVFSSEVPDLNLYIPADKIYKVAGDLVEVVRHTSALDTSRRRYILSVEEAKEFMFTVAMKAIHVS